MAKKNLTALSAIAALLRKGESRIDKGIPGTRTTTGQMESLRRGTYEQIAREGAGRLRIFKDVT